MRLCSSHFAAFAAGRRACFARLLRSAAVRSRAIGRSMRKRLLVLSSADVADEACSLGTALVTQSVMSAG